MGVAAFLARTQSKKSFSQCAPSRSLGWDILRGNRLSQQVVARDTQLSFLGSVCRLAAIDGHAEQQAPRAPDDGLWRRGTGLRTRSSSASRHPLPADVDPSQSGQGPQGPLPLALAAAAGGTPRLLAPVSTAALAVCGQRR